MRGFFVALVAWFDPAGFVKALFGLLGFAVAALIVAGMFFASSPVGKFAGMVWDWIMQYGLMVALVIAAGAFVTLVLNVL